MRTLIYWPMALFVLVGCSQISPAVELDTKNRVVDVVNTTESVVQFFATNAETRRRAGDRISESEIPANSYLTVNFVDGSWACLFDLYAVLPNGQRLVERNFDTCAEVSWVVGSEMGR